MQLKRSIGIYSLTMVAIGSCIGSGIFLTPSQIANHLPQPFYFLLVWVAGGVITLTGALTFAELGGLFPEAGGVYVYLRQAYGDLFGFLYGWGYLVVMNSGAIVALSLAFAQYLSFLVPLDKTGLLAVAAAVIVLVTCVNILGVRSATFFSNLFTGLKLVGIGSIIAIGLFLGKPAPVSNGEEISGIDLLSRFGLALIGVLWSFGGWQHASYLSGETVQPRKSVPRAMVIGAVVVTVVYVLTNLAYLYLLPISGIAASTSLAADAISSVLNHGGIYIALLIMVSTIGTTGIYTLSSPRIYHAMASDGIFFRRLSQVHPKFRTPVYAILVQSCWSVILLLFWKTFENAIAYVVFIDWIFFTLAAFAVFIFRRRLPGIERPIRTPGYPVTPLVFVTMTTFFVINTLIHRPLQAVAGLLFMGIGALVFVCFKIRRTGAVK